MIGGSAPVSCFSCSRRHAIGALSGVSVVKQVVVAQDHLGEAEWDVEGCLQCFCCSLFAVVFSFSVYDFSLEAGSGVKLPVGWLACVSLVVDVGVQLPLVDGHIRGFSGLPIDLTYPCLL